MDKSSFLTLMDNSLVFLWGIFFLLFPFIMSTASTDAFLFPKEIALTFVIVLSLLLWATKIVVLEKVTFQRTPFDVPVLLFLSALVLSSLFSVNRADSLLSSLPVVAAGLSFFVLSNTLKKDNAIVFCSTMLLVGAAAVGLLAIFSYLRVYPILFSFTHIQSFSPIGSLLEQAFYFVFLLPVAGKFFLKFLHPLGGRDEGKQTSWTVTFAVLSLLIAAGLTVTLIQLFTSQRPLLLPFETGFQSAFAAISQDSGRIAQGFVFGSGYGNFSAVFTRFKQATFNTSPLWTQQFSSSSSYLLELLATTGILGFLSYLFLLFRLNTHTKEKKTNPLYWGLVLLSGISIVLPFSFVEIAVLFLLLGLFVGAQGLHDHTRYYDVELKFVALKKGMISLQQITVPSHEKHEYNRSTAWFVAGVFLALVALTAWFGGAYVYSDMLFQKSLVLASANNGTGTYQYEVKAINIFPYRSIYYRIFSQTNIALAGSLSKAQQGSSPNSQTQSTLYALLQQGVTAAKTATTLSPQTVANWQNLSSVYRSLIGVGQNADNFAILASQQAITLDPNNPEEYLALGGIYYQLGQWDNAIREFQQATTLKGDFANAYYNLGHAYEQKADYQNALTNYQTVQQLVSNDPTNLSKVTADIAALQKKMGSAQSTPTAKPVAKPVTPATTTQPLQVSGQLTPNLSPTP